MILENLSNGFYYMTDPSFISGPGLLLVLVNLAIMAISGLSIFLVCMRLWEGGSATGEAVIATVSDTYQEKPFRNGGMDNSTTRKSRTVSKGHKRRTRYPVAAPTPSHAINISITSAPESKRELVQNVEHSARIQENRPIDRPSQASKPPRTRTSRRSIASEVKRMKGRERSNAGGEVDLAGEVMRSPSAFQEGQRQSAATVTAPVNASAVIQSSPLQDLGFERVIRKSPEGILGELQKVKPGSISQQLVEMNRKVRQGA